MLNKDYKEMLQSLLDNRVDFEQAYPRRKEVEIDGIKFPIISKEDLIHNKESTGREKDKLDSKFMRE